MASNDHFTDLNHNLRNDDAAVRPGLHPLHEAAMKLAGLGLTRSKSRTRDIVAMLLSHGARAWRASQPSVKMHLHVTSPSGRHPIRMRVK